MRIAIMQPYFFPYLGYYQLASAVDHFVFLDDVNFIKKGYINRNSILGNKQAHLFTVPLANASQNELIKDIKLSDPLSWKNKWLKTLAMNYSKAPFYNEVIPYIISVLEDNELIVNWATQSIKVFFDYLGISFNSSMSSSIGLKDVKGEDRIISICKHFNSDVYINSIGGRLLYSKTHFSSSGIELKFLEMKEITYKQFQNNFVPNLSIIDIMMFNDKEKLLLYLKQYSLDD